MHATLAEEGGAAFVPMLVSLCNKFWEAVVLDRREFAISCFVVTTLTGFGNVGQAQPAGPSMSAPGAAQR